LADGDLVDLLSRLVAIDSVNPDLVPGGAGEREIGGFVAEWLERAGLDVAVDEPAPGRPNVVATARGTGSGRSLLLNAHMDTVGVAGMDAPLEPRVEGGRLYGRGAYDMKGSLAAIMLAGAAVAQAPLAGDVIVTAVSDEEVASIGTAALARSQPADAAIVTEPTELDVAIAHRGFVGFEIETRGVAAHGSRPDLGEDAIRKMGPVLVALDELDQRIQAGEAQPYVGTGSLHASLIEGGQEFSSYPERCLLTGEWRTLPGQTTADVERDLRATAGDADVRLGISRQPFAVSPDEEIVRLVHERAGSDLVGVPFWTDAALLAEAGIPTLLFGPAGEGAHAVVEWVELASVERCRDVLLDVAKSFCGAPS
jgi:acetylornithine deacetylase